MKPVYLIYLFFFLLLVIGFQTWYIQKIQRDMLEEKIETKMVQYKDEQSIRDSIIEKKINLILQSEYKIKEFYYTTQKIIDKRRDTLQNTSDSSLANILNSLIEKRKRTSYFNKRKSD